MSTAKKIGAWRWRINSTLKYAKKLFHKVSPPTLFPSYMVFNSNTHHNVTKPSKYVEWRICPGKHIWISIYKITQSTLMY